MKIQIVAEILPQKILRCVQLREFINLSNIMLELLFKQAQNYYIIFRNHYLLKRKTYKPVILASEAQIFYAQSGIHAIISVYVYLGVVHNSCLVFTWITDSMTY